MTTTKPPTNRGANLFPEPGPAMNPAPPSNGDGRQTESPADGQGSRRFVKLPVEIMARKDLTPSAKLVWAAVADRIGENGHAWPGIRRIAVNCGLCHTTVLEGITKLEAAGLLVADRVTGNPGGKSNHYRLPERAGIPNASETRTFQNSTTGRSRIRPPDVRISGTEPDPCNQTHVSRPRKTAQPNPGDTWLQAQEAMTTDTLKTDAFKTAWLEWVEYRRQAEKPLMPATVEKQIRKLEAWGTTTAIASIDQSITAGWPLGWGWKRLGPFGDTGAWPGPASRSRKRG